MEHYKLVYYLWCFEFGYDCNLCETHAKYLRWLEKDTKVHCGDCTNHSCPCERCELQRLEIEAQKIIDCEKTDSKGHCGKDCLKECDYKLKE